MQIIQFTISIYNNNKQNNSKIVIQYIMFYFIYGHLNNKINNKIKINNNLFFQFNKQLDKHMHNQRYCQSKNHFLL